MDKFRKYRVGLLGGDLELLARCKGALGELAKVGLLDPEQDPPRYPVDVILLVVEALADRAIDAFVRCRQHNPTVSVILLTPDLEALVAVELVKCGAEDLVVAPVDGEVLLRKVERALDLRDGSVLDLPLLRALARSEGDPEVNRRRCYRAPVPPGVPASVEVATPQAMFVLDLKDISVDVGDQAGGMCVVTDSATARELGMDKWPVGKKLELYAVLPGGQGRVRISARVASPIRPTGSRHVALGLQYVPSERSDIRRFQTFWMECQRRLRTSAPPSRSRRPPTTPSPSGSTPARPSSVPPSG